MKKIIQNKKLFILILSGGLLALVLLFVPHLAEAQLGFLNPINLVGIVFRWISYFFSYLIGFFFMLGAWFTDIVMTLNEEILKDSNALVKIGWTITRDLANLGFVLIMIIMAVATIVRYEKYAVQKLLPLLIGAAILVNFSLTIAGVFLNFSNILSRTFTKELTTGHIADVLAGAFNPQRLLLKEENPLPPDPASQGNSISGNFSYTVLGSIAGLVFNIVFVLIATLSMFTLALMLFYRYLVLSFLLVLAPLAWLFWVFPDLQHLSTKWWNEFLKWVFFLPASTFFLYLAVKTAEELGKNPIFISGGVFSLSGFASLMSQGAQMIVLAGLLLGGLIVAQKMGIHGADGAMKLATKAKDGALKYAGNKAQQVATAPLRASWGKKTTEWMQTAGQNAKWYNPVKFTGLAALTQNAGRGLANVRMAQEKKAVDVNKNLPKDLKEQALMAGSAQAPEQVAIMGNLSKEWNNNVKKARDAKKELASAMEKGDEEKITKAAEKLDNASENLKNVRDVINLLPKNIRDGMEGAVNLEGKRKGEMEMKNIKTGPGYMTRRYGHREGVLMPGQSDADTVLEATKKALGNSGDESGGGPPKRVEGEIKEEKPADK